MFFFQNKHLVGESRKMFREKEEAKVRDELKEEILQAEGGKILEKVKEEITQKILAELEQKKKEKEEKEKETKDEKAPTPQRTPRGTPKNPRRLPTDKLPFQPRKVEAVSPLMHLQSFQLGASGDIITTEHGKVTIPIIDAPKNAEEQKVHNRMAMDSKNLAMAKLVGTKEKKATCPTFKVDATIEMLNLPEEEQPAFLIDVNETDEQATDEGLSQPSTISSESSMESSQEGPERNRTAEIALHHRSRFFGLKPRPNPKSKKRVIQDPRPNALSSDEGIAWLRRKNQKKIDKDTAEKSRKEKLEMKRAAAKLMEDAKKPGISEEKRAQMIASARLLMEQYLPKKQSSASMKVARSKVDAAKNRKKPPIKLKRRAAVTPKMKSNKRGPGVMVHSSPDSEDNSEDPEYKPPGPMKKKKMKETEEEMKEDDEEPPTLIRRPKAGVLAEARKEAPPSIGGTCAVHV